MYICPFVFIIWFINIKIDNIVFFSNNGTKYLPIKPEPPVIKIIVDPLKNVKNLVDFYSHVLARVYILNLY